MYHGSDDEITVRGCWWSILLLGFCLGCADPAARPGPARPAMRALGQQATIEEEIRDETIGRAIRRRFELVEPTALSGVIIQVNDGAVTLRGVAPSLEAAWRAEAAARGITGVGQVINQILVQ